ncbi:MAG: hypothetical protein AAGE84_20080 [Cyanobacteria bacterium P01_G01_bin.39]
MIDGYIENLMQDKHIPGMSVGVVASGETLLMKGYGIANLEHSP